MINRFSRIHQEFGIKVSARIVLLLIGLVATPVIGWVAFSSLWPALAVVLGLVLGWVLRRTIVDRFEALSWALPAALFAYGIVLFIGERLGLPREAQLLIITVTTVIVFDLQFWWFSDPSIVATRQDGQ
ncbi:MAG TPA: hypothetical protein VMZ26_03770 [Pyrinomonadaceae bacterium]|nr:hypothetical protein [Pyrinomonadaceae bacterium]